LSTDFSLCNGRNLPEIPGVPKLTQQLWMRALVVFAFWTLLGLAFASQFYFSSAQFGNPVSWGRALAFSLADWWVFAVLSLPAIWLARRAPIERPHRARAASLHAMASVAFSLAYITIRAAIAVAQSSNDSFALSFKFLLFKTWNLNLVVYWFIISVSLALDYGRKLRERELRAAELEKRLTEARLQALQMQLNPHFLFNTLHAISALMHQDVEAADRMLVKLSDLLRRALDTTDTQEVTLREELEFLRNYAEIEQTRFGDRLKVEMNVAPETLNAFVPNLILQPLVENAIKHGIEPYARPGKVGVFALRAGGVLRLEVRDNGGGLTNGKIMEGIGLSNTRGRLEQLYDGKQKFTVTNGDSGGVTVVVEIPFREET
jgi:two-component system, LytTR family, sensor kinase